ncbi:urease accessory protein UreF [Fulvimarina endophytica]|nr:urease accessory UreF family protein [Fulvimarina endophytica]
MAPPLALLSWLSPVFPIGGYAYSAGLETAIAEDRLAGACDLTARIARLLASGFLWNDAVFLATAHRSAADETALLDLAAMVRAFAGSAERLAETFDQGRSFMAAVSPWAKSVRGGTKGAPIALADDALPLPVAIGRMAALHDFERLDTLAVFLHGAVLAQLQAAIRLSLIGQTGAADAMSRLEPAILETAERAATATPDDLGTACFAAEIDALRHETLAGRLFLS